MGKGKGNVVKIAPAANTKEETVEEVHDRLITELKEFFEKNEGFTAYNTARQIGVGGSTLNQWLNNKYPGAVENVNDKVAAFLEQEGARRIVAPKLTAVNWEGYDEMLGAFVVARDTLGGVIITGDPGVGKTFAAEQFLAQSRGNAALIYADCSYRLPLNMVWQIATQITGGRVSFRLPIAKAELERALQDRPRMLIINDAQTLGFMAIDLLCAIAERCKIPLALVGHPEIEDVIQSAFPRNYEHWDRVDSRFERCHVEAKYTREDFAGVAVQILKKLTVDGLDALCAERNCRTMRDVQRVCAIARKMQLVDGVPADAELIDAAAARRRAPLRSKRRRSAGARR